MSVFLEKIVAALSGPTGLPEEEIRVLIETPRDSQHGEYAFPCFVLAKSLRKGPPAIAKDLAEKLSESEDFTPIPTGAYLNFRIRPDISR